MFEKLGLARMAQSLAAHSAAKLDTVARNVANADTPGFRAQDVAAFGDFYGQAFDMAMRHTRPGHFVTEPSQTVPLATFGSGMAPNGNDVSLDQQMMEAVEARQNHEMALAVYRSTSAIIRTSLGREQ